MIHLLTPTYVYSKLLQFGMYSSVSKFSDADKAERRQRGINIEYTGPVLEGLAKETS